jgi:dTMP kinase
VLLAIEGIDGAGKTTQVDLLCRHFAGAGFKVTRSKEPTTGPYGQMIRASASQGRMQPAAELETLIKDRRQHIEEVINPALLDGQVVVIDRYYLSTVAYQGARGLDPEVILQTNEIFAPEPALFVILEISPALAMQRIHQRGEVGRNDFEQEHELAKCAQIFAAVDRPNILRLDGAAPVKTVHQKILCAIDKARCFAGSVGTHT